MGDDILAHPEEFPELSQASSFEDFQAHFHTSNPALCPIPCEMPSQQPCHTSLEGEPCYAHVRWAMKNGIFAHPEWFPELSQASSFEDFQAHFHTSDPALCPIPCDLQSQNEVLTPVADPDISSETRRISTSESAHPPLGADAGAAHFDFRLATGTPTALL